MAIIMYEKFQLNPFRSSGEEVESLHQRTILLQRSRQGQYSKYVKIENSSVYILRSSEYLPNFYILAIIVKAIEHKTVFSKWRRGGHIGFRMAMS